MPKDEIKNTKPLASSATGAGAKAAGEKGTRATASSSSDAKGDTSKSAASSNTPKQFWGPGAIVGVAAAGIGIIFLSGLGGAAISMNVARGHHAPSSEMGHGNPSDSGMNSGKGGGHAQDDGGMMPCDPGASGSMTPPEGANGLQAPTNPQAGQAGPEARMHKDGQGGPGHGRMAGTLGQQQAGDCPANGS
jgi:hypothetical protein